MSGLLLGGSASPLGWCVQFLDAAPDAVITALGAFPDIPVSTRRVGSFPGSLHALLPLEAPWTRELVLPCAGWTAYLNNGVDRGDPTAHGIAVAAQLGVRCVIAEHTPLYGPGHQATQLWVLGPDGDPPLMYRRTLSAVAEDGRWNWHAHGEPFPFEDTERYTARRIRDRFDRGLLLTYLNRVGIPADDDHAYGQGVLIQNLASFPRRSVTLDQARRQLGLH